jgi:hypothetical protein
MTYEYMTGMGDAGTLFRLNILNFGPSVGRSCTKESTNACCQTAMAMPDAELARVAAPYAAWSGLSSQGRQGNYMELLTAMQEWRRSTPCPDEIANEYKDRRIEANMDEAGRTAAVKGAMFWGAVGAVVGFLKGKPLEGLAVGTAGGALLGYGNGRARAEPRSTMW